MLLDVSSIFFWIIVLIIMHFISRMIVFSACASS